MTLIDRGGKEGKREEDEEGSLPPVGPTALRPCAVFVTQRAREKEMDREREKENDE